jgi:hypothetical protein
MSVTMNNSPVRASEGSVTARLMPLLATVLLAFLVIGVALPVLPLHVRSLGFGLPSTILILPKNQLAEVRPKLPLYTLARSGGFCAQPACGASSP